MRRYAYDGKHGDMYWKLRVWYDLDKQDWGVPDEGFHVAIGRPDGSGTGFNQRDIDWAFADEASALEALARVKQVIGRKPGFHVNLDRLLEDEDEDNE